jgi:YD repeat-containing protein
MMANITSETDWTYIYDLSNQLIRVQQDSNQVAENTYNGAGHNRGHHNRGQA